MYDVCNNNFENQKKNKTRQLNVPPQVLQMIRHYQKFQN